MFSLDKAALKKAVVFAAAVGILSISACSDEKEPQKVASKAVESASNKPAEPTYEDLNNTLLAKFDDPGIGQPDAYIDIRYPTVAFQLYNSLRSWDESGEDIAKLLKLSISPEIEIAEVFSLGHQYGLSKDEFEKRDLANKISEQTKIEAGKVKGKRLVSFLSTPGEPASLNIGEYDFDSKGFKIDDCLFSDKLEYTKEEKRLAQTFRGARQERCYFRTFNSEMKVGFTGGSKVLLKVEDESLARKIASERNNLKVKVYGYIESVRRDRVGGQLVEERIVLIAPQKIELIDDGGQVVLATKV